MPGLPRPTPKKGKPPVTPITLPGKMPRHHLSPQDAKHQDILHVHQNRLLEKINAGEASPEDHKKFGLIRQRLNQMTQGLQAKIQMIEQSGPKRNLAVKNVEEEPAPPAHPSLPKENNYDVRKSQVHPYALDALHPLGITQPHHLLHLVGIPTHVRVDHHRIDLYGGERIGSGRNPGVGVSVRTPLVSMNRVIYPDEKRLYNTSMDVEKRGKGLGSGIFYYYAKRAAKLGFTHMDTLADGHFGSRYNGYYTWPRLGYEAPFDAHEREQLPPEYQHARSVQHLFSMPGGMPWWHRNGWAKTMRFDLRPGSNSHHILDEYDRELTARKLYGPGMIDPVSVRAGMQFNAEEDHMAEEIDLAPWEEEALDRAWERLAKEARSKRERERRHYDFEDIDLTPEEKLEAEDLLNKEEGQTHNAELVPSEKGSQPIPEGHVRLYHYTRGTPESIRGHGILLGRAKGSTYGEPNLIWGSTLPPGPHHTIVEFHVPASDISHHANYPEKGADLRDWESRNMHATLVRDIQPHEILAIHEPWHDRYRYIASHPDVARAVLAGEHDDLMEVEDYGPAIRAYKAQSLTGNSEPTTNAAIHSHDTSGGKWVTTRSGNHMHHRLHTAPTKDTRKPGKGKKPSSPLTIPERADPNHLTAEQQKHQHILHDHQDRLLQKINSGEATHDDHRRFSEIRDRLNEFHEHADRNKEDKDLLEKEQQETGALEQQNWARKVKEDKADPEDVATRKLREKHAKRWDKLAKKRAKKMKKHFKK